MTTQHASAEATVTAQVKELKELKQQLDSSSAERSLLSDLSIQQQASIDDLQQQLTQMKTDRETIEKQLTGSKALMSQLQASVIVIIMYQFASKN